MGRAHVTWPALRRETPESVSLASVRWLSLLFLFCAPPLQTAPLLLDPCPLLPSFLRCAVPPPAPCLLCFFPSLCLSSRLCLSSFLPLSVCVSVSFSVCLSVSSPLPPRPSWPSCARLSPPRPMPCPGPAGAAHGQGALLASSLVTPCFCPHCHRAHLCWVSWSSFSSVTSLRPVDPRLPASVAWGPSLPSEAQHRGRQGRWAQNASPPCSPAP